MFIRNTPDYPFQLENIVFIVSLTLSGFVLVVTIVQWLKKIERKFT